MNLEITGKNIDLTDPLRDHVTQKIKKLTRHFEHVIDIHVILEVIKREHHAEATVNISGKSLFAEARNHDMYSAIDMMIDKLDRQILKAKDKMQAITHESIADNII